jgi:LacI family transcriptional regulator
VPLAICGKYHKHCLIAHGVNEFNLRIYAQEPRVPLHTMPKSSSLPTVIAVVEPYNTWNAGLVRGIDRYATEHECWRVEVVPQELFGDGPASEDAIGILVRATNQAVADFVLNLGLPVVNLSTADPSFGKIPQCSVDELEIGRIAAEHLLERGFKHFSYLGSHQQRDGYLDRVQRSFWGQVEKHCPGVKHDCDPLTAADPTRLRAWIEQLPKPVGLLAWNAIQARRATDACRQVGIVVPHDVAVVCGEHDDVYCDYTQPTLTSVQSEGWRVGYAGSALLREIIESANDSTSLEQSSDTAAEPIWLAVSRLVSRESTNTLAVEDRIVADAVAFIQTAAITGIGVEDVVRKTQISRRALEQRFQACVNRSPGEEIRRVRLEHAQGLLLSTDLNLAEIAAACGMSTPGVLLRSFTKAFKITPAKYRKERRREASSL